MKSFLGRLGCAARRAVLRFRAETSGNVAIMAALLAVVLMLSIGAAVDIGRWLNARDQTLSAVDAAVLAGGRVLQTGGDDDEAVAAAKKYYTENVTSRLPVVNDSVNFVVNNNGMGMQATGTAYITTPFLQFASISKLPLISLSQTDFSGGSKIVPGKGNTSIEVAVMLDITLSMAGQKIEDLKDAASDLINIVVWDDQSKYTSKVALVPFSEDIRLPSGSLSAARGSNLAKTQTVSGQTYYLTDCVVERTATATRYTDDAPANNKYVLAHYVDQNHTTGSGNNRKGSCTVPASGEVVPLTSNKTTLLDKIKNLSLNGGTAGHLGTAWAWYMLSPNWSSLWSVGSQPKAYGTADLDKIAILMTDGEYNTQYSSKGVSADYNKTSNCTNAANGCSAAQARSLCTNMKAKGITVYTIGFGDGITNAASQTLSQCATDPGKYYNAKDGDELKQAFRDIALKLTTLYLSK